MCYEEPIGRMRAELKHNFGDNCFEHRNVQWLHMYEINVFIAWSRQSSHYAYQGWEEFGKYVCINFVPPPLPDEKPVQNV